MAIQIIDLSSVYDEFLKKGLDQLKELQKDTEMEDEQLANTASNIIVGAMQNSVSALEALKRVELLDLQKETEAKKALDIASSTSVRDAQSKQDLLNKASEKARIDEQTALITKQAESEAKKALDIASSTSVRDAQSKQDLLNKASEQARIDEQTALITKQAESEAKKALDIVSSTSVRDAQSTKDLLVKAEQIAMSKVQQEKVKADGSFVSTQETQLKYSVIYNNRLKTLKNYSDTLSNIGLGGFVIPSSMWSTYFDMANDCYINWGDTPADKTFETASDYPTTKA